MKKEFRDEIILRAVDYMENKEANKFFFWLIPKIMEFEINYNESKSHHEHLKYIYENYGQYNYEIVGLDPKCKEMCFDLKILYGLILWVELDDTLQEYYELYKQHFELLKQLWKYRTQKGIIRSKTIYKSVKDSEILQKLNNEYNDLDNKQILINSQIKDIEENMSKLYSK